MSLRSYPPTCYHCLTTWTTSSVFTALLSSTSALVPEWSIRKANRTVPFLDWGPLMTLGPQREDGMLPSIASGVHRHQHTYWHSVILSHLCLPADFCSSPWHHTFCPVVSFAASAWNVLLWVPSWDVCTCQMHGCCHSLPEAFFESSSVLLGALSQCPRTSGTCLQHIIYSFSIKMASVQQFSLRSSSL